MRWDLYLNQTQGAGTVTLAVATICFGMFSWWYLFQRLPWQAPMRPRLTKWFWIVIIILYLVVLGLILFCWPEA